MNEINRHIEEENNAKMQEIVIAHNGRILKIVIWAVQYCCKDQYLPITYLLPFGTIEFFWSDFPWLAWITFDSDKPNNFSCLLLRPVLCFPEKITKLIEAAATSNRQICTTYLTDEYSTGNGAKNRANIVADELHPQILQLLIHDWYNLNLAISWTAFPLTIIIQIGGRLKIFGWLVLVVATPK